MLWIQRGTQMQLKELPRAAAVNALKTLEWRGASSSRKGTWATHAILDFHIKKLQFHKTPMKHFCTASMPPAKEPYRVSGSQSCNLQRIVICGMALVRYKLVLMGFNYMCQKPQLIQDKLKHSK